jgi:hypothetical protein
LIIPHNKEESLYIQNRKSQPEGKFPFLPPFLQISTVVILMIGWILILNVGEGEAKRKRRAAAPPLKIIDISTSPTPYVLGGEPLALTIEVEIPKNLKEDDLVEVSSFISFPSKRSIRFLSSRHPVSSSIKDGKRPKVQTTLFWDGTDHTKQQVEAGIYQYEVKAQVLSNQSHGFQTKLVSFRARGTLEVFEPEIMKELNQKEPPHTEHIPFTSDDLPPEELEPEEQGLDPEKTETVLEEDSTILEAGESQEEPESKVMPTEH